MDAFSRFANKYLPVFKAPTTPAPQPKLVLAEAPRSPVKATTTPEAHGAIGNNEANDGPALRKAAAYLKELGGGTIVCGVNKVYKGDLFDFGNPRKSIVHLTDNMFIDLRGSTIKTNESVTNFDHNVLDFTKSVNCGVSGGKIIGNYGYTSTNSADGEWGMGIGLYDTKQFFGTNLDIEKCGGDAIYVGRMSQSQQAGCHDVHLKDVRIKNCMRQGISVISVKGMTVDNLSVDNIRGKDPQAGIDFEPNKSDEQLTGIRIRNFTCTNSHRGILFYLINLDKTSKPIDIQFEKVTIEDCAHRSISFVSTENLDEAGNIHFKGLTSIKRGLQEYIQIPNNEGCQVTFDDVLLNTDGVEIEVVAPLVVGTNGITHTAGVEKVLIKSLQIYGGLYERAIVLSTDPKYQRFIKDIDITITNIDVPKVGVSIIVPDDGRSVYLSPRISSDANKSIRIKAKQSVITYRSNKTKFDNNRDLPSRTATGSYIVLKALPIGIEWTVYCDNDEEGTELRVANNTRFLSMGPTGQSLHLVGSGAWVKLMRVSDTEIKTIEGLGFYGRRY